MVIAKIISFLCQTERSKIRVGYEQERKKESEIKRDGDRV
jgi:hypothetical protein